MESNVMDIKDLSPNMLNNLEEVYICPSFKCNLVCPHCSLHKIQYDMDLKAIKDTLSFIMENNATCWFTLFGGEPLALPNHILESLQLQLKDRKHSMSTNLLLLNDSNIKFLKNCNFEFDTSWNPLRFGTGKTGSLLYNKWKNNLLKVKDLSFDIMVTLTKDLISNFTPKQFLDEYKKWNIIKPVKFEYMIGDETLDFQLVDNWLLELYKLWDMKNYGENYLFNELKSIAKGDRKWGNKCNEIMITIMPDGKIKKACAYFQKELQKTQCKICEYYNVECFGGCPIQEKCTFPKNTYKYIKDEMNAT